MKRYRVFRGDLDTRALFLEQEISEDWSEEVKETWRVNRAQVVQSLTEEFGEREIDSKIKNFLDLDTKPFSIVAFHNRFFEQARRAFVIGAYYPALTAACALGERVLNHLVLCLRDDFRHTPEFKRVYRKDSFDDWEIAISTLEAWNVLLPEAAEKFRTLAKLRHQVIHFRPEVDRDDREFALKAIHCLRDIIATQFSGFGPEPWFITGIPGEIYIKKDWENKPFIQRVYLPNCALVGPQHVIVQVIPRTIVNDDFVYEDREITDDEFVRLRTQRNE